MDTDILVKDSDAGRAGQLLLERGYKRSVQEARMSEAQQEAYAELTHQNAFWRQDETIKEVTHVVELQWSFASRYFSSPLDPRHVWARPGRAVLAGTPRPWLRSRGARLVLVPARGEASLAAVAVGV